MSLGPPTAALDGAMTHMGRSLPSALLEQLLGGMTVYGTVTANLARKKKWLVQFGKVTGAVFSGGQYTLVFPKAFPKSVEGVMIWPSGTVAVTYVSNTTAQVVVKTADASNPTLTLWLFVVGY